MDLKTEQTRYKVFMDESYAVETDTEARAEKWRYYELRGRMSKHGLFWSIYPYSESHLAVLICSNRVGNKTRLEHPSWMLLQNGEDEMVFALPNADLEKAAAVVHPAKKRQVSEKERSRLAELSQRFGFRKRNRDVENTS